ncbi:MAG: 30S ribosomal protein S6, partial [Planctomycetota bacterium]
MKTREYEAMFLLDNAAATEDFEATAGQVDAILEKHGAEIVHKEKWDERKLAYEIKGHRRATYYLVYMRAPTQAIAEVRQDVALNEVILRHLVIALDEPIDQHIENRAAERERLAEDSRKTSLAGWGDRKKGGRDREAPRPKPKPAAEAEASADDEAPAAAPAPEASPAEA